MAKVTFDKRKERAILHLIEVAVSKFSLRDVTHAVNKWNRARMIRAAVQKERRRLQQRLAELR
jgi:hypothetical protein